MKRSIQAVLGVGVALALLAGSSAPARAGQVVVTFEADSNSPPGVGAVADGYGGITWGGEWKYLNQSNTNLPAYSPPNRVFGVTANTDTPSTSPSFSFASPVVFNGAYFSGLASDLFYVLSYQGDTVYTSPTNAGFTPNQSASAWFASGYSGQVDKVTVLTSIAGSFGMDNVTYTTSDVGAVPEPSSVVMLGLGGLGLAAAGRRRASA